MEVTLEQLLKGKATQIGKKEFYSTKDYIDPFLQSMSKFTDEFICKVKEPKQISIGEEKDVMYNRVYIQAVLPKNYWEYEDHQQVISLIYGLDCKVPVVKIFRGGINMACLNLCVFNATYLNTQVLEPQKMYDISPIKNLMNLTDDLGVKIKKLKNTFISRDKVDMTNTLGKWVDFCIKSEYKSDFGKAKLSPTTAISAYKNLVLNPDSEYYIPEDEEVSLFTAYNAFTELLRDDKDVVNPFEKNLLLNNLFEI
jgi:hypothetical protein|nr:MAG TPA: hypothetical protein [Caudoviricetes sp.]